MWMWRGEAEGRSVGKVSPAKEAEEKKEQPCWRTGPIGIVGGKRAQLVVLVVETAACPERMLAWGFLEKNPESEAEGGWISTNNQKQKRTGAPGRLSWWSPRLLISGL